MRDAGCAREQSLGGCGEVCVERDFETRGCGQSPNCQSVWKERANGRTRGTLQDFPEGANARSGCVGRGLITRERDAAAGRGEWVRESQALDAARSLWSRGTGDTKRQAGHGERKRLCNRDRLVLRGESHERCRSETGPARVCEGARRQAGNQTLKAQRRRRWNVAEQWLSPP